MLEKLFIVITKTREAFASRVFSILNYLRTMPLIAVFLIYVLFLLIFYAHSGFLNTRGENIENFAPLQNSKIVGILEHLVRQNDTKTQFILKVKTVNDKASLGDILITYYGSFKASLGSKLLLKGNLVLPMESFNDGQFNYARYLATQNVHAIFYANEINTLEESKQYYFLRLAQSAHDFVVKTVNKHIPNYYAGVLSPMLIGDESLLDTLTKENFTKAGVMHILVVSGMNVAYVAVIIWFLFRLLGFSYRVASLGSIPFILLYVFATGATPPVLRAGVMAIFVVFSLSLSRPVLIYHSLSLAAFVILIFDPRSLFSASFQLSFGATVGIVYFYKEITKLFTKTPKIIRWVCSVAAASFAAQLAVLPILAYYFGRVSLIGLLSNIFIVPLSGFITTFGFLMCGFELVSATFATLIAKGLSLMLFTMLWLVKLFAQYKYATIVVAYPSFFTVCCYYLIIFSIPKLKKSLMARIILFFTIATLMVVLVFNSVSKDDKLSINFLSLERGRVVHIALPNGKNWLIDCSGSYNNEFDPGKRIVLPYLLKNAVLKIDKVFISNVFISNYGGLRILLESLRIGELFIAPQTSFESEYVKVLELAKEKNVPTCQVWADDVFKESGVVLNTLWPRTLLESSRDNTVVFLLEYQDKKVLLAGDAGQQTLFELANFTSALNADVMQINNRKEVINRKIIEKLNPKALIVCGRGGFDCFDGVMSINTYITSKLGRVSVIIDNKKLIFNSYKK